MIASDIDGTLLDYGSKTGAEPLVNHALISQIAGRTNRIAIVTNQGGLAFGWQQRNQPEGRTYPTPGDFVVRLHHLNAALNAAGILISSAHISLYHPAHTLDLLETVRDRLWMHLEIWFDFPINIHLAPDSRKPSPKMLYAAKATTYYGDSTEDEAAALAAGCEFVRVARFGVTQKGE
jgi:hypothetical protein